MSVRRTGFDTDALQLFCRPRTRTHPGRLEFQGWWQYQRDTTGLYWKPNHDRRVVDGHCPDCAHHYPNNKLDPDQPTDTVIRPGARNRELPDACPRRHGHYVADASCRSHGHNLANPSPWRFSHLKDTMKSRYVFTQASIFAILCAERVAM